MEQWIEQIEAVSRSMSVVSSAVNGFFGEFLVDGKVQNPESAKMVRTLTSRINNSSNRLMDCLTDLSSMSLAVKEAMLENPDVASCLKLNILNTFIKQLLVYYKETFDSFQEAADGIYRERTVGSCNASVAAPAPRLPQEDLNVIDETGGAENVISSNIKGDEKKKRHLKVLTGEDVWETGEINTEDNGKGLAKKDADLKKRKHLKSAGILIPESNAELNGSPLTASERTKSASPRPGTQVWDAEYLRVMTTVEDALGSLVLSAGPNVFTAPEAIMLREPITSYYITLSHPGCLGPLLHANYIALDEEMEADFMCDVLRTEYVEVEPFESPAGEVVVNSSTDLRGLPVCAWRLGFSEDRDQMLYTMYVLVDRGPNTSHSLLVRDLLCFEQAEQEEVLHVITVLKEAPQFAEVTVYSFSPNSSVGPVSRKHASDRLSALVNITKSIFEKNGYVEVSEEETRLSKLKGAQLVHEELLTRSSTATPTFRGTVELAPLDDLSPEPSWGLSDIAKGAVRGAAAVVKAPVVATKAMGSAVLDVSGVTGAIKSQTEGWFRRSFPQIAHEELIEAFHCALVEDGNPIPKQGCLFITPHWLCFQSPISNAKFNLEWDEIKDVQKQRTVKLLENAIAIETHLGGSYFLTSFAQRDQAFGIIMKQWLRK